jgi:hypothetical protein
MADKVLEGRFHFVTGLDPVADAFAATVSTDVINASGAHAVHFIRWTGVGATGTSTLTVEACDDTTPSNTTAIPFMYKQCTATGTSDVFGGLTRATASGFATTAGSGQIVVVSVDADAIAATGYKYVRLKGVEVVDSPVLGGYLVMIEHATPRNIHATAIT